MDNHKNLPNPLDTPELPNPLNTPELPDPLRTPELPDPLATLNFRMGKKTSLSIKQC